MATVHPAARDEFRSSLRLAKEATTSGVIPATATKTEAWWLIWLAKCTEWEINPIQDPSTNHTSGYLAAFAMKYAQENLPERKTMLAWKRGNRPTCQWPDGCPTGAQPP